MKIKYKLIIVFLFIVVIFAASALYTINNIGMTLKAEDKTSKDFSVYQQAKSYEIGSRQVTEGLYLYVQGNKQLGTQLITVGSVAMDTSLNDLKESVKDPNLLTDVSDTEQLKRNMMASSAEITGIIDTPLANDAEQNALLNSKLENYRTNADALNQKLSGIVETSNNEMTYDFNVVDWNVQRTIKMAYYTIAGSLLISLILTFATPGRLTSRMNQLAYYANRVSKGDIYEKVKISSKDELGDLAGSFKRMVNSFKIMEALLKEESNKVG